MYVMNRIRFSRFDQKDQAQVHALIACYQAVFAGPPWNEEWTFEQVQSDLAHEITDDASCWLAWHAEDLIGFCWGYPIDASMLKGKLDISLPSSCSKGKLAYQDDLGVLEGYRGQGIAKQLFKLRHEDFLAQGLTMGVVRTKLLPDPSVTFLWFTKRLGYQEIARYPRGDGRIVLGADLGTVTSLL